MLPVDAKALRVEPLPGARLSVVVGPRRAAQIDVIVLATLGQERRVEEAGVDDMEAGQEVFIFEPGVDDGRDRSVSGQLWRCFDVGDQGREIIVARFGDVRLVADPLRCVLLSVMGILIVG